MGYAFSNLGDAIDQQRMDDSRGCNGAYGVVTDPEFVEKGALAYDSRNITQQR